MDRGKIFEVLPLFLWLFLPARPIGTLRSQTVNLSEQYLLIAANQERLSHHLQTVELDPLLSQTASNHAREMALRHTISHQFQGEADLATRAGEAGVRFSLITENVAEASNSSLIHDLWMRSEGHRANLLDPHVDRVGISVIAAHGQLYAVEDFIRSVRNLTFEEQEAAVAELIAGAGLKVLNNPADARQTCMRSSGFFGSRQPWFVMRYTSPDLDRLPNELSEKLQSGKFHEAAVGACSSSHRTPFTSYNIAVMLYP